MKLPEFCRELRDAVKAKREDGWTVMFNHELTGILRFFPPADAVESYCPLTLVCLQLTGQHRDVTQYHVAAGQLGVTPELASRIACAADGAVTGRGDDDHYPVRKALVAALREAGIE